MRNIWYRRLSFVVSALTVALSLRQVLRRGKTGSSPLAPRRLVRGPSERPGEGAESPSDIPARGWWQVAKRVFRKFSDNELMSEAASVTFYALLSIFPAVTAIVSIYGLFADPSTIGSFLDSATGFVPSGGMDIIKDQVKRLTASPASGLSLGAIVGVLAALWSANQGTKAMQSALNDVYGEREDRSFIRKTAISLAFTVGGVACLLVAVAAVVVVPAVLARLGVAGVSDVLLRIVRWPLLLLGIGIGLAFLYRFGPSRRLAKWRWVTWGGAIAALLWVGLSIGFSWYVEHFGNYNKTYGSLGAVIGFMTWIWLSCTVLLIGGQINAEMETQTLRDSTTGRDRAPGARGAAAADHVA